MAATNDRNYRQPLSTAKAQKGKKQNLVTNSNSVSKAISKKKGKK